MSLQDLANLGEGIGGIAVLISLVYLALQIRQNTRTIQSTAFQQVVDSFSQISLAVGLDRGLTEVFMRANQVGLSALDPVDQAQMRFVLLSFFRRAESAFFHSQQGTLDMESWEGIRESLKGMLQGPAVREFWEGNAGVYNSRFRAFVESELRPSA
jgi:hypothetical protein